MDFSINRNNSFSINSLKMSFPNSSSNCSSCQLRFYNDKEFAEHQLGHLEVNVSPLLTCPFCHSEMKTVNDSFHHTIQHFSFSKCEQSMILKWLSQLYDYNNTKEEECEVAKPAIKIYQSRSKVFELGELFLKVPAVPSCLRCFICKKYFNPESISKHIFGHYNVPHVIQKMILIWFENFFNSKERTNIEENYQQYLHRIKELPSRVPLIENLSLNESQVKICKNCHLVTSTSKELFAHSIECFNGIGYSFWNCVICNYQAPNSRKLIDHMWDVHIYCVFCNKVFLNFDFEECIMHIKFCSQFKCPICFSSYRNDKKFLEHLGLSEYKCVYCFIVFIRHKEWLEHLKLCATERVYVRCPCCHDKGFSSKSELENHILNCKPWLIEPREPIVLCEGIKKKHKNKQSLNCTETRLYN